MRKLLLALSIFGMAAIAEAAPVRYVQISTNTITRQTGTSVIAGLNVSTANIANATISSATLTTVIATSATFTATSPGKLTLSSTVVDGSLTQGTAGQSLQSNAGSVPTWVNVPSAILSTTSSWTAAQTFSSATVKNLETSTITYRGNQAYVLLYSSTNYDTSGSSATTVATYVPTKTSITVTPKSTTSRIELSVSGCLETSNGNTANGLATLYRGSTDLSPNGKQFCISDAAVAGVSRVGCSFTILDDPGTTSATTYTVRIRTDSAGTSIGWSTSQACISQITAKEWGY